MRYELLWSDVEYSVLVDGELRHRARIVDDFNGAGSFLEFVDDPNATKPEDWEDKPFIFDEQVLLELARTPEMIYDPTEVPPLDQGSAWKRTLVENPEYLRL